MTIHARLILVLSMAALLVAPAIAVGCSQVVGEPARPRIAPEDLRFLGVHRAASSAWVRGDNWFSTRVGLAESIQPRFLRRPVTAAYAQQRSVRLDAVRPIDGDYADDDDPATPPCALVGRRVYSATRLLVKETPRAIFITLASHRTPGSTEGCRVFSNSCDDIVSRFVSFDAPIGDRRIYAVTFPAT